MKKHISLSLLFGFGLAILFDALFYQTNLLGINVLLVQAASLFGVMTLLIALDKKIPTMSLVSGLFSIGFASIFALFTNELSIILAWLGLLTSNYFLISSLLGHKFSFDHPIELIPFTFASVIPDIISRSSHFFTDMRNMNTSQLFKSPKTKSIVWGFIILIPILLIFTALLSGADEVFSSKITSMTDWFSGIFGEDTNIFEHIVLIGLFTPLFWYVLYASTNNRARTKEYHLNRSSYENQITVITGGVTLLFAFFLAIQAKYLFGGEAAFDALDYTYSEYATKGFWELIVTAGLVVLVIMPARTLQHKKSTKHLNIMYSILIAETIVLMYSAYTRLSLYIDQYHYTSARILALFGIVTVGIILIALLLNILLKKEQKIFFAGSIMIAGVASLLYAFIAPEALASKLNQPFYSENIDAFEMHLIDDLYKITPESYQQTRGNIVELITCDSPRFERISEIYESSTTKLIYGYNGRTWDTETQSYTYPEDARKNMNTFGEWNLSRSQVTSSDFPVECEDESTPSIDQAE